MKQFREITYIILLIFVCALFFYRTLFRGMLPVPTDTLIGLYHPWRDLYAQTNPRGVPYKNFLITDPVRQQIPWRKLAIDELKKGKLPTWNRYNFSGSSLIANIQAGTFYPLNLLFMLMPFPIAWSAIIMIQPFLAGLFLYFYVRYKKIHPGAATIGAIAWSFSGFFIAWLTWGTIDQTALWLPLILLSIDHVVEKQKHVLFWFLVLIFAGLSTVFAGHIQVAAYVLLFAAVYGLFRIRSESGYRSFVYLFLALAIVTIVTSVQWLPFISLVHQSARLADSASWLKEGWFLPWKHVVQFIAPDFFGNPATLNYWGVWNYGELVGYIGVLPLIAALYAALTRKDRLTKFFSVSGIVILIFLLPTPIAKIPYQLRIPLLSSLQPTRLMVLLDFCLVILASLGLDYFYKNKTKQIWYAVALILFCFVSIWTYIFFAQRSAVNPEFISNITVAKRNIVLPSLLFVLTVFFLVIFSFVHKKWKNITLLCAVVFVAFDLLRFGWKFTPVYAS